MMLFPCFLVFKMSKNSYIAPLAVSIDQVDRLGGDDGYIGVYRGNAFAPIKPPTFPTSRKPRVSVHKCLLSILCFSGA